MNVSYYFDPLGIYEKHFKSVDEMINEIISERNKIGILLFLSKNDKRNSFYMISNELIHLILSYSHPLAPQTKYCERKKK